MLGFYLLCYILPLGVRDLFVPDETRYAEIPREMIVSGNWVVPHLNGVRYFEKPALGYWVHAGSILLFGESNFAVRLPSALAVGFSALLIYMLVYRIQRAEDEKNGWLAAFAALVFLTCFEVIGVSNFAVLDNLFSFFLTATIAAFYSASEAPPGSAKERGFLILAGISCGLAFLTKGFLALAVPVLTLGPYLVQQHRYRDLWRMSRLPILAVVLVCLPWSTLIQLREPDFWRFFFWNEHIRRFMADNAQHQKPLWFFFMAAPGVFMPWTFLIPAAISKIGGQRGGQSPEGQLIRLSICWLVLPFLFFSVSSGKLLTYILPCFPPFAILMAFGLSHVIEKGKNKVFQWGVLCAGIFFGLILLALIYVQLFGYKGFHAYNHPWKWLLAANSLLVIILFSFWSFKTQEGRNKLLLFGIAPILFFFTCNFITPDLAIVKKAPGPLLKRHKQEIEHKPVIISDMTTLGAVCWYLQRSDVYVLGGAGELDYGLKYKDAAGKLLDMKSATSLIKRNRGKVALVARVKHIRSWRDFLPKPAVQDDSGPEGYVVWQY